MEVKDNSYSGVRYLVSAFDAREFSVTFNNGRPTNIKVFNGELKPNESVLAYDDDNQLTLDAKKQKGVLEVVGFEIRTDDTGRPKKLNMSGYEYEVKPVFAANGELSTTFTKQAHQKDTISWTRAPRQFTVPAIGSKIENPLKTAGIARLGSI